MLLLYSMKEKISVPILKADLEIPDLITEGFLLKDESKYILTNKAKRLITKLDNYFVKAKKKTNIQLMGKDYSQKIEEYRNIFPAGKLPSGKPARQNVKALGESFRWFFETYDHDWEAIIKATKMYVNQYRDADYLYMMTSQYFVAKQDKHKVKHSTLADYCDMIKDGVQTKTHHFKERVV
jgi:hypothetical protein